MSDETMKRMLNKAEGYDMLSRRLTLEQQEVDKLRAALAEVTRERDRLVEHLATAERVNANFSRERDEARQETDRQLENFAKAHERASRLEADLDALAARLRATEDALQVMTAARDMQLPLLDASGRKLLEARARLRVAREALEGATSMALRVAAQIVRNQKAATMVVGADPLEHAALILDARAIDLDVPGLAAPTPPVPPGDDECHCKHCEVTAQQREAAEARRKAAPLAVPVPPGPPTLMLPGQRCTALAKHTETNAKEGRGVFHLHHPRTADWWRDRPQGERCPYVEPVPATPNPAPRHECPSCDLDDSVKVPPGKLLKSTPIATPKACASWCGKPGDDWAKGGDAREVFWYPSLGQDSSFAPTYCTAQCRDAGRPLHPANAPTDRP